MIEAASTSGATFSTATARGVVVFQGGCPQVGVIHITHRSVGEILVGLPCGAGCRLDDGVLLHTDRLDGR